MKKNKVSKRRPWWILFTLVSVGIVSLLVGSLVMERPLTINVDDGQWQVVLGCQPADSTQPLARFYYSRISLSGVSRLEPGQYFVVTEGILGGLVTEDDSGGVILVDEGKDEFPWPRLYKVKTEHLDQMKSIFEKRFPCTDGSSL